MMDIEKLIEQLKKSADFEDYPVVASFAAIIEKKYLREAATAISTLQAENARLRYELEQVKRENDALWIYIEIVDREYRRYMDRGYIDRLDELKKVWKNG